MPDGPRGGAVSYARGTPVPSAGELLRAERAVVRSWSRYYILAAIVWAFTAES